MKEVEAGYSILIALVISLLAAVILLLFFGKKQAPAETVKDCLQVRLTVILAFAGMLSLFAIKI